MQNHEEEYTAADREWNEIARMHPNENPFTHLSKGERMMELTTHYLAGLLYPKVAMTPVKVGMGEKYKLERSKARQMYNEAVTYFQNRPTRNRAS